VRAAVDTALVKKLRAETKGGVMACRDALEAAGGDFEKARAVVLGTLKSRAGRVMGEGLVAVWAEGDRVAAVEVACETDFVARGPSIARLAAACAAAAGSEGEATEDEAQLLVRVRSAVAAELTEAARATSERIELRRAWRARHRGRVASYVHAPAGQARVASVAVLKDTGKEKSETEEAEAQVCVVIPPQLVVSYLCAACGGSPGGARGGHDAGRSGGAA
jgi:elongation factor Ts